MRLASRVAGLLLAATLTACQSVPVQDAAEPLARHVPVPAEPAPRPVPAAPETPVLPPQPPIPSPAPATPALPSPPPDLPTQPLTPGATREAAWPELPDWYVDELTAAWPAWLQSCQALKRQIAWRAVCNEAETLPAQDGERIRRYFETRFQPRQVIQADGSTDGLVTGYYEPLLQGSRTRTPRHVYPLRAPPDDLLTIDLSLVYPELKNLRLRGRLDGNRVVPYYPRGDIEAGTAPNPGREIAWVDDPVELLFLQIQGSGRLQLDDGSTMRIGYADQNGHPYKSIGKWLVETGELTLDQASMQGIKNWARTHPERVAEMLAVNPSYVFFRELNHRDGGPLGALGVPLTDGRSLAIDPRAVPLGAPVWLATTRPNSSEPLRRLMLAQDTGGAIKGNVRADFFWGFGEDAGRQAGAMKQKGRMWVLLPAGYPLATNGL